MRILGLISSACRYSGGFFLMLFLLLFAVSCTQITAGKSSVLDSEFEAGKKHIHNPSVLEIVSKGATLKELKQPRIYFRYIQYSIDDNLLGAHMVKDDYKISINLLPGKHKLHVERLTRAMLSARAYIMDEGDCYIFTLSEGQTGKFEGKATPDDVWETIGFSGVQSWEKVDSIANCNE